MKEPIVVSYGGGTNSTALLVGWLMSPCDPPDAILFSDTGGERPEVYKYVTLFSEWLVGRGAPPITVLRKVRADHHTVETLEENCLTHETLPSLAYGYKRCSQKFKIQPMEKWCNNWHRAKTAWRSGYKVVKVIGFDAGEPHRAARGGDASKDGKYRYRYPLIEWGWDRERCVEEIRGVGLPLPGKSSCFYCPASTKQEIEELARGHPLLFQRALAIEDAARDNFQTVKGLGRRFAWRDIATVPDDICEMEAPCECVD